MINEVAGYTMSQTLMAVSKRTRKETTEASDDSFLATAEKASSKSERGSVMADYYARKPEYKSKQVERVNGGYSVLASMGVTADDLENMSFDEFRMFMTDAIQSIPHDVSRPYDEETVTISKEGWENMKKDPDYAAWVLGYLKEDRSVRNPFAAMGDKGSYCIQSFGASPSEYHGHVFSKIYGGTALGARSMYNSSGGGKGIVTNAPQAHLQPAKDYDINEEKRKARKKRQKELLEEELQAKYEYHRKMSKYLNEKAFQESRARSMAFGGDMMEMSAGSVPMMPTAFFDAAMLLEGLM